MDNSTITRQEHEEFARRIDDENNRQNRRIAELEENVKEIHKLTLSMERMSANMQSMLEAIERQGNFIEKQTSRIDKMEREPADNYKQLKTVIITAIITFIISFAGNAVLTLL